MTAAASARAQPAGAARSKASTKHVVLLILLVCAIAFIVVYGLRWWTVGRFIPSTNDAFFQADVVAVAPEVAGYISQVLVLDNQHVAAGDPLVQIDPQNYQAAYARAKASFDAAQASIVTAEAQTHQQQAQVLQARARLTGSQVNATFAGQEAERYRKLTAVGAETADRLAQMVNTRNQAAATVAADTAGVTAAERQTETLQGQLVEAHAQAEEAQAALHRADLDLQHTLVRARIAGRVGDRSVQLGQFVQPGTRLLSIVPVQDIYVVANFKETQMARMQAGQPADISVDALDGRILHGTLDSFAPGTGAEFALLPPENATGNFTKIVQRVGVRVRLRTDDATLEKLVPGLSATVSIDTRPASR